MQDALSECTYHSVRSSPEDATGRMLWGVASEEQHIALRKFHINRLSSS